MQQTRRGFVGAIAASVLMGCGTSASGFPAGRTNLSRFADASGHSNAAMGLIAAVAAATPNYAFATPVKQVYIDTGTFRIASEADLSGHDVQLIGAGGTIVPALGRAGGKVISSSSGILELVGVEFDGGNSQPRNATGTTWIIFVGNPSSYMNRVRIEGCMFRNCTASDGTLRVNGAKVTHVIYANGLAELDLVGNAVDTCSGAAVFLNNVASFNSRGNNWAGTDWYSFNIAMNSSGTIDGDKFSSTKTSGVYWGGAVNTVNARGREPNRNITVRNCTFNGYYSYGAIIRLQSDNGATIEGNTFLRCDRGSLGRAGGGLTCIRVSTWKPRGLQPSAAPTNIRIVNNRALMGLGGGSYRVFIYADNTGSLRTRGLTISGNVCRSPDANSYFTAGVLVNGKRSGLDDVRVTDNDCELYMTTVTPLAGGIAIAAANPNGLVNNVEMSGNRVKNLHARTGEAQSCYQIGPFVDNLRSARPNTAIDGYVGLRTNGERGRRLNLGNQIFEGCVTPQVIA